MEIKSGLNHFLDRIANGIEVIIAALLLIVVAVEVVEIGLNISGLEIVLIEMPFESILAISLNLVIGVEFVKMLYKHTPASVINVLLFATARLMIVYHERAVDLLIGAIALAGLFATKRFLIDYVTKDKKEK
jgi:hypothetical protein